MNTINKTIMNTKGFDYIEDLLLKGSAKYIEGSKFGDDHETEFGKLSLSKPKKAVVMTEGFNKFKKRNTEKTLELISALDGGVLEIINRDYKKIYFWK